MPQETLAGVDLDLDLDPDLGPGPGLEHYQRGLGLGREIAAGATVGAGADQSIERAAEEIWMARGDLTTASRIRDPEAGAEAIN